MRLKHMYVKKTRKDIQEQFQFKIQSTDSADPEQTTCIWYVSE